MVANCDSERFDRPLESRHQVQLLIYAGKRLGPVQRAWRHMPRGHENRSLSHSATTGKQEEPGRPPVSDVVFTCGRRVVKRSAGPCTGAANKPSRQPEHWLRNLPACHPDGLPAPLTAPDGAGPTSEHAHKGCRRHAGSPGPTPWTRQTACGSSSRTCRRRPAVPRGFRAPRRDHPRWSRSRRRP